MFNLVGAIPKLDLSETSVSQTVTINNGVGANGTYNISYANLLKWGYNQTTATNTLYGLYWYNYSLVPNGNTYNSTYNMWSYNQSDGSYNATYDGINNTENIQGLLNLTNIYSTFNSTYDGLNSSYNKFWYNYSLVPNGNTYNSTYDGLIKWGYNMSDGSYNATYALWGYNQTTANMTTNSSGCVIITGATSVFNVC